MAVPAAVSVPTPFGKLLTDFSTNHTMDYTSFPNLRKQVVQQEYAMLCSGEAYKDCTIEVYLCRHGYSEANKAKYSKKERDTFEFDPNGKIQDPILHSIGMTQSMRLGYELAEKKIEIHGFCCSQLFRAIQTACLIKKHYENKWNNASSIPVTGSVTGPVTASGAASSTTTVPSNKCPLVILPYLNETYAAVAQKTGYAHDNLPYTFYNMKFIFTKLSLPLAYLSLDGKNIEDKQRNKFIGKYTMISTPRPSSPRPSSPSSPLPLPKEINERNISTVMKNDVNAIITMDDFQFKIEQLLLEVVRELVQNNVTLDTANGKKIMRIMIISHNNIAKTIMNALGVTSRQFPKRYPILKGELGLNNTETIMIHQFKINDRVNVIMDSDEDILLQPIIPVPKIIVHVTDPLIDINIKKDGKFTAKKDVNYKTILRESTKIPNVNVLDNLLFGNIQIDNDPIQLPADNANININTYVACIASELCINNPDMKTLDLSAISEGIGYAGIIALAEGLKMNTTLTSLTLGALPLDLADATVLMESLEVNTTLKNITLAESGSMVTKMLQKYLADRNSKLAQSHPSP